MVLAEIMTSHALVQTQVVIAVVVLVYHATQDTIVIVINVLKKYVHQTHVQLLGKNVEVGTIVAVVQ